MTETYDKRALVLGASGAIGDALVRLLIQDPSVSAVFAASRSGTSFTDPKVTNLLVDSEDEESLAHAAEICRQAGALDLIINAIGLLHDGETLKPERALRDIKGHNLARLFWVNSINPALMMKYFSPLMTKDRPAVLATLSARVGSIGDNKTGGWYGYRASKAALNQLIKTAAIELAVRRPNLICVGLHPGTVRSAMSEPFLAHYTKNEIFTPEVAAKALLEVIANLTPSQSGRVFAWDGQEIQP
jgi:NAD(P)-dependent dehydrogenase (short-subunit alcohol dehydrogenase family)